jgi:hypothetical protein
MTFILRTDGQWWHMEFDNSGCHAIDRCYRRSESGNGVIATYNCWLMVAG